MKIVSVGNQKGGVGKTTTAHALAIGLSSRGYRVLAVDMDPQRNLSYAMGAQMEGIPTAYEVLRKDVTAAEAVFNTPQGDLITSSVQLSLSDKEFNALGREYLLKEALETLASHYDFCVIDTPPALGILTINTYVASNELIIPMDTDAFAMQGMVELARTVSEVRRYSNPELKIAGILLTRYEGRAVLNKTLRIQVEENAKALQTKVFDTFIRKNIAIKEAQLSRQSIYEYAPYSNAAFDYRRFVREYLKDQEDVLPKKEINNNENMNHSRPNDNKGSI